MVSLSGTVSAAFHLQLLTSSGSLEPPVVKIRGGSSDAMQVRAPEPPGDPEPPPGTVQSPLSVFQSSIPFPSVSKTLPSSSKIVPGAMAWASVTMPRTPPQTSRMRLIDLGQLIVSPYSIRARLLILAQLAVHSGVARMHRKCRSFASCTESSAVRGSTEEPT